MKDIFERMICLGALDFKPLPNLMIKLTEEAGELAEAVNHHEGYLPHKTLKEPIEGEVADVINCAVAVLRKAYPTLSNEVIYDMLHAQLVKKANKWEDVINHR